MGGIPTPGASADIVAASKVRAMAVPALLVAAWGKARWEGLRDEMQRSAERQTGQPHVWRSRHYSDVYELVPVGSPE
jgi:hypothetical protein